MHQQHVFWQALILTILVFGLGVLMGIILENWRTSEINSLYLKSEIDLLDIRLQAEIFSRGDVNCNTLIEENLNFADQIYEEAKILERYEKASRLTDDIIVQHKKYDILRAMILVNSLNVKENCDTSYYDVVYFYEFDDPSLDVRAKQKVLSRLLGELKSIYGDEILLLPIAGDNKISSIDLILDKYDVSEDELPIILINGKKVGDIQTILDLEKHLN